MNFIDYCKVKFVAGKGGSGVISFLHEKYRPFGGPDGGDGGDGGSIYLTVSKNISSLEWFQHKRIIKASDGENGKSKNKHGSKGADIYLTVPENTWIINAKNQKEVLKILINENEEFQIVKGGIGGVGNARFKTSKKQTPYCFDNGDNGEIKYVIIELKLLADIGLVGFPNAGKSSLLNSVANTNSIVGNYSFTTLIPVLGRLIANPQISVVDIPGLISGAQFGKGLGFAFLRHIEHCQSLFFVLDGSLIFKVIYQYRELINIIQQYKDNILRGKQSILINKSDLLTIIQRRILRKLFRAETGKSVTFISALTRNNIAAVNLISKQINHNYDFKSRWAKILHTKFVTEENYDDLTVKVVGTNVFLESKYLARIVAKIPPVTQDNRFRLQEFLSKLQIEKFLSKNLIDKNKKIYINNFQYLPNNQ